MEDFDHQRFVDQIVETAQYIELMDALGTARAAQATQNEAGSTTAPSLAQVEQAQAQAAELIKQANIVQRLCPGLKSVSDDLKDIAKVVAAAMLPLSLGPQAIIPVTPVAFGALALVIFRMGVRSLCPDNKEGST